jgi:hypothetical protein
LSTVSASVEVHVPPEQLFTHIATLWESGAGLGSEGAGDVIAGCRMGTGFRLHCVGREWGIPRDTDLEVQDYVECAGWRAISRPEAVLSWTVWIAPHEGGAELSCQLLHAPRGLVPRVRDCLVGRRRRRRALRRLVRAWKASVERQQALRRLRGVLEAPGPGPPDGGT